MKKAILYFSALLIAGQGIGCKDSAAPASTTDSTSTVTNTNVNGDGSTTSTTKTTHHRYTGKFMPKPEVRYIDLRTHKEVTVRIDTIRGIVNSTTNEPIDLFVEPGSNDTIYGPTGTSANHFILRDDNGIYQIDESKFNSAPEDIQPTTSASMTPISVDDEAKENKKYKEKVNGDRVKIKTDDIKIKKNGDDIKVKERR